MTATLAQDLTVIEQKVEAFIQQVVTGVEHDLSVIGQPLTHVSALIPQAAQPIAQAAAFIEGIPRVGQNPPVMAAVAAANIAMQGLNAFAGVWNQATAPGGPGVTATVAKNAILSGYQGYRSALAAVNSAQAAAVAAAQVPKPTVTAS